ncbi:FmdB family zinc ribbon protein [Halioxenophilus aromaticivorans]|uniref:Putative regulatory protein FmdB zinc ribbon domain-containing protein n=1 Tax=Halioxenophilus aromaticivorans TaxID=1306992 RepID=A0AAV3TWK4_9ALTE
MPIYEYVCGSCQHELEALQKIADDPLVECPQCHESSLKKKISAAGFRLAGSGWYETDFKKGGKQKNLAGDAGAKSSVADSSSSGNSSSSKPAATDK